LITKISKKMKPPLEGRKRVSNGTRAEGAENDSLTRGALIALQAAAAAEDTQFRSLIAEGDKARDARDWPQAEYSYWRALQLYPYHQGYRVQYAHMLKERHDFIGAELHYRSALALGMPVEDIKQHLEFTAGRNGFRLKQLPTFDLMVSGIAAPPTARDIEALAYIFFHRPLGPEESLKLIRECKDNKSVALTLIADDRLVRANLPFLEMLRN
jgi:hypothetical protein